MFFLSLRNKTTKPSEYFIECDKYSSQRCKSVLEVLHMILHSHAEQQWGYMHLNHVLHNLQGCIIILKKLLALQYVINSVYTKP
jgi:hypothetical protein